MRQAHIGPLYAFLGGDAVCMHLHERGTPKKKMGSSLSTMDRLLLTLIRLRKGWDIEDIALLFGIGTSTASTIFYTWIQLMYLSFKRIQKAMFISRHDQPKHRRPGPFKRFKNFRCVFDTTEIKIDSIKL